MKNTTKHLRTLGVAVALAASFTPGAQAAIDTQYDDYDLMFFGLKKSGPADNTWDDNVVTFSLGSTYDVFRKAATPGDATYGTVISLGNINAILTSAYGTDWTSLTGDKLYFGAAGQNGATSGTLTAQPGETGDVPATVYITSPRLGAGTYGELNSTFRNVAKGNRTGVAGAIAAANSTVAGQSNPFSENVSSSSFDNQNVLTPGGALGSAYTAINGGVAGLASTSSYSYDTINNVVLGLDLYRVSHNLLGTTAWQNVHNILPEPGYGSAPNNGNSYGFYLGTITLSGNGDVNFVGTGATPIPEPGTIAAAVLLAGGAWLRSRKRAQLAS